jgi:hypothetical protein
MQDMRLPQRLFVALASAAAVIVGVGIAVGVAVGGAAFDFSPTLYT